MKKEKQSEKKFGWYLCKQNFDVELTDGIYGSFLEGNNMKRAELEKNLGKIVEITLFDGDVIEGELHKTREERFINEPNLYIPYNYYFLINPQSCIFRCSHVKKIRI